MSQVQKLNVLNTSQPDPPSLMVDGSVYRDVYHGLMVRRPFFVMPNQWYIALKKEIVSKVETSHLTKSLKF